MSMEINNIPLQKQLSFYAWKSVEKERGRAHSLHVLLF